MDFGRVRSLDGISFAVPPLDARSQRLLATAATNTAAARAAPGGPWLRAGAPAWGRKDWLGRLYPKGTSDRDFLRVYAQRLGAIELNASYYRVPSPEQLDAWAADVPETFQFCPKLHKDITHRGAALADAIPDAVAFAERFLRLGPRLGPAFLQLPPWLGVEALPALDHLVAALPLRFRIAVEFRHPSWFHRNALRDPVRAMLERHQAGAVITDVAGRRDVCHTSITAPFVIVRFVGNDLHPSDGPRTDAWLDRLVEWRALGLQDACFFAHQPDDGHAPETLQRFVERARDRGIAMPAVTLVPTQLGLF